MAHSDSNRFFNFFFNATPGLTNIDHLAIHQIQRFNIHFLWIFNFTPWAMHFETPDKLSVLGRLTRIGFPILHRFLVSISISFVKCWGRTSNIIVYHSGRYSILGTGRWVVSLTCFLCYNLVQIQLRFDAPRHTMSQMNKRDRKKIGEFLNGPMTILSYQNVLCDIINKSSIKI